MTAATISRAPRWSRWAVVAATGVTIAALLGAAWSSYAGARAISRTLVRGQAETLLAAIRQRIEAELPPSSDTLAQALAELGDDGLRFVAVAGRFAAAAGEPMGGPIEPARNTPLELRDLGDRFRATANTPPRRGPPPLGWRERMERRDRRAARPIGALVIEFEPSLARQMIARARTSLAISGAVAAALAVAAAIAFRLLRRREELEAERAQQAHLATLGSMSAVLAHEIRNPLASLKGHAQLLAEALHDDHAHHRKAERVVRDAVRLEQLTDGLLAFVRTGALDRRDADPREPLRSAVAEVGGAIAVDDTAAPSRWPLDPPRLQQVLENVLRNARQASPDDAPVDVQLGVEAGELVYRVRDRGTGIGPGEEELIFEPFRTSKASGTGLGLAVARRIVELHGGTITARNRDGGGAELRIALPPGRGGH